VPAKHSPFEKIQHISQGRHICNDAAFKNNFKEEFERARNAPPGEVSAAKLGKLFGADPYYNMHWFTE
jgi:hypothetical protein